MTEIGHQTHILPGWGSLGREAHETNPALQWPLSIEVFDKMRREDSQVGSVLRAVTLPVRSTSWMIDPAGARPEVVELIAADLGLSVKGQAASAPKRKRDKFSWDEHLRLALLELVFGHSVFEQVYRLEGGLLRLRKLAWRPPRTIASFDVAADGGLVGVEQHGAAGRGVKIPASKLVVYVNEREGANWLGVSLLRTAYKNWLLKDRMLRAQALTIERNGLGIPLYKGAPVPDGVTQNERDEWIVSQREEGLKLAQSTRAGEDAGVSIPEGADFSLMGVTGKLPDTDNPIRYHDEQIARAVLAHFLNLGTETGSWALGSTFANFFTDSLNALAGHIADIAQQHIIEDLVDLNWGPEEPAPQIVCAAIGAEQPATADAVKILIDCGAVVPDDDLEAYMRSRYQLPVKSEVTARPTASNEITDAQLARASAEVTQKVYLGVGPVLDEGEARAIVDRAGGQLKAQRTVNPEEGS